MRAYNAFLQPQFFELSLASVLVWEICQEVDESHKQQSLTLFYCYIPQKSRFLSYFWVKLRIIIFVYKYDVPFITVPAKINGSVYDLLLEVDTGSDRVLDLNTPFVNSHNLLDTQKPFAISRISSSDGGSGELKNVFFEEVRIGQYVLPKVAGAFSTLTEGMQSKSDIDGTLGNNFLKRFNMVIDFDGQTIWLQPNNYLYTPFYGFLVK